MILLGGLQRTNILCWLIQQTPKYILGELFCLYYSLKIKKNHFVERKKKFISKSGVSAANNTIQFSNVKSMFCFTGFQVPDLLI